jgi:hypothetical protein
LTIWLVKVIVPVQLGPCARGAEEAITALAVHPYPEIAGGHTAAKGDGDMRFAKLVGLGGALVLVVMAFAGTGLASAESACLEDPEGGALGECPEGKEWTGPIFGLATGVVFTINDKPIPCKKSEFLADYLKNEGEEIGVLYLILYFTFEECNKCTVEMENEPFYFLVLLDLAQHGILTEDEEGVPAILFKNCDINGVELNCLYESSKETLLSYVLEKKDEKPLAGAFAWNKQLFRGDDDSQLCDDEARIEATYLTYEDYQKVEGAELFFTIAP